MREIKIDMQRLRDALPKHAVIILRKDKSPWLDCYVRFPSLSEPDFEMCKDWQREIIGSKNISEFYTEETGNHWIVYFKNKIVIEFINTTDKDLETYSGLNINEIIRSTIR